MSDKQRNEKFERLRQLAENMLHTRAEANTNLPDDFAELIHELEVHQIELEMQHAELERAYDALERTRKQFNDLFDFAPVGYIVTTREGVVQQANLTIAALLGVERNQLIGQKFSTFVVKDYKETYHIHRRTLFRTEEQQSCDVRVQCHDESRFFAHLNSEIIPENPDTCRTSITDISQIKQAESALKRSLYREKELNALKSRLIEVISHEMRTPLSTILSSIELLDRYSDRMDDAKRKQRYDRIRTYIWYLNAVVDDVLIAHRTGDDAPIVRTEQFDVTAVLEQLVEDTSLLSNDQNRVEYRAQPSEQPQMVTWDQQLFRRIVVNLLQNALKYSDGQVTCALRCDDQQVTLRIRDVGEGILEADQKHIFDMFYRGSNTTSIPGTGVGLPIVKAAVEAHHGTITFETSTSGTTFIVKMPRHVQDRN